MRTSLCRDLTWPVTSCFHEKGRGALGRITAKKGSEPGKTYTPGARLVPFASRYTFLTPQLLYC